MHVSVAYFANAYWRSKQFDSEPTEIIAKMNCWSTALLICLSIPANLHAQAQEIGISETGDIAGISGFLRSRSLFISDTQTEEQILEQIIENMFDGPLRRFSSRIPREIPEESEELRQLLEELVNQVLRTPGHDFDPSTLFESCVNFGMREIDPYFQYLSMSTLTRWEALKAGNGSIGIKLSHRKDRFIITPLPGSPAESSGLVTGDRLISINSVNLTGRTYLNAVSLLKGDTGSVLELGVRNRFGDHSIEVEKTDFRPSLYEISPERSTIKLIKLDEAVLQELEKEATKFTKGPLILDLRGFQGSTVDDFITLAEMFLEPDELIYIEEARFRKPPDQNAPPEAPSVPENQAPADERETEPEVVTFKTPVKAESPATIRIMDIRILQDHATASSAEALIVALKNSDRLNVTTIGEKTFGKALIQKRFNLLSGGRVYLSVKQMLKPDGTSWEGIGLEPDVSSGSGA